MSWEEKKEAEKAIKVPEMPELITKPFNENKLVAPLCLRVEVSGLANGQQDLYVRVARKNPEEPTNLRNLASMPYFKKLWRADTDIVCHLVKIDPSKPFDALSLEVIEKAEASSSPETSSVAGATESGAFKHRNNLRIDPIARPDHIAIHLINAGDFGDQEIESDEREIVD